MNERIRELIEQCTVQEFCDYTGSFETFDKEKFAELIVAECSRIADDWVNNEDNGKNYPSEIIKKHFGVEE